MFNNHHKLCRMKMALPVETMCVCVIVFECHLEPLYSPCHQSLCPQFSWSNLLYTLVDSATKPQYLDTLVHHCSIQLYLTKWTGSV